MIAQGIFGRIEILPPRCVVLAKRDANGRLRDMRAPRFVSWSLFALLALCGKTGAVPPPKPSPAAAPAPAAGAPGGPAMSGAGWATPPPADVAAPPADAERDPNGIARKIDKRGTGTTHPSATTFVDLRYGGWERNGHQFEGTPSNGSTGRYSFDQLAQGMQKELPLMVEGEKRRIWVPSALAYGKQENFVNAPRGDMTFEVELQRIVPFPATPPDVKAAPKEAKTTKSGLAYVVLKKGTGKAHPTEDAHAEVIYSAWTPDGKMFQCSLAAGDTARVLLKKLPLGWREAMLHMVEGDKWRLWLPGKLAFGEARPGEDALPFGPPTGPVVFDVELVKILAD
jgi:peptidylprolyl isomerase